LSGPGRGADARRRGAATAHKPQPRAGGAGGRAEQRRAAQAEAGRRGADRGAGAAFGGRRGRRRAPLFCAVRSLAAAARPRAPTRRHPPARAASRRLLRTRTPHAKQRSTPRLSAG
jgi:hypothetical protein